MHVLFLADADHFAHHVLGDRVVRALHACVVGEMAEHGFQCLPDAVCGKVRRYAQARRKSASVMIPSKRLASSTTGKPLMRCSTKMCEAADIVVCGETAVTG